MVYIDNRSSSQLSSGTISSQVMMYSFCLGTRAYAGRMSFLLPSQNKKQHQTMKPRDSHILASDESVGTALYRDS
jgi:hypothetical protein